MLQIEYNSSMIVRLVEELLSISRTLKENWILSQLPETQLEKQDFIKGVDERINQLLRDIIKSDEYVEEVDVLEDVKKELKQEDVVKKEEAVAAKEVVDVKPETTHDDAKQEVKKEDEGSSGAADSNDNGKNSIEMEQENGQNINGNELDDNLMDQDVMQMPMEMNQDLGSNNAFDDMGFDSFGDIDNDISMI